MAVLTPSKEFKELMKKLDELEEKVENTNAEIFQRAGKKVGRDIGILYGLVLGIIIFSVIPYLLKFILYLTKVTVVVK
ncbi:tetrahydromethanopterin S-methyltransferase subunit G [Methanocaldococcus villosus KIN24-T80]|uniref:Tetrahydromethanopterin S-methyltransferase subunit G n=1 Tax=Methanocaldococcus villosus KIN24-T80 TaxID=1069083 RepID=N6V2G1_9EURY|nr:tetrahydromethanopterin S-methyltransferase subunit G [Methanocaldococcus villosus]ENN96453.1 tetrahydromethanopterin S-methyltransferase subunit G [Methanocaldococcus villosus KIN24-T80]